MRKFLRMAAIGLLYFLFWCSYLFAVPDPRDSVIIESKTVYPGNGPGAAYVKVWITNKDTLAAYELALVERSVSGGAYMTLAHPRSWDGIVRPLTTTLQAFKAAAFDFIYDWRYNSTSPDYFVVAGFCIPTDIPGTAEPPNPTRKALFEIKFDTVLASLGAVELDSGLWTPKHRVAFFGQRAEEISVNFVKGVVTVAAPGPPPCDLSGDGEFSATDLVSAINCVFLGIGSCKPISTPADIVALLYVLYSNPKPLIPPPNCD